MTNSFSKNSIDEASQFINESINNESNNYHSEKVFMYFFISKFDEI